MITDYAKVLQILTENGVQFVVIGGVAANLHGSARVIFDANPIGAPENRLRIAPNCHLSVNRETTLEPLFRKRLPGPNGSSSVPFERNTCVR